MYGPSQFGLNLILGCYVQTQTSTFPAALDLTNQGASGREARLDCTVILT